MKKDKNSSRSRRWMQYNDFTQNEKCKDFLVKLFELYGIEHEFKGKYLIARYQSEVYRIVIDAENVIVKLINRRSGVVRRYYSDRPYKAMCEDIISAPV